MADTTSTTTPERRSPAGQEVVLVASGDQRLAANQLCWPAQAAMEERVTAAVRAEGAAIRRGHPYIPALEHGFIDSQKYGMEVFRAIDPAAPIIVAEAVWQYSQHVLAGLAAHRGPILTVANWSGEWPGLVGLLNLNASLTKAGVAYSSLWSRDFTDDFFQNGLREWLQSGAVAHDCGHVCNAADVKLPRPEADLGRTLAQQIRTEQAIIGVFDEGCMGMFNAIVPDRLLNATGVYKERFSQSALYAAMLTVGDDEARAVRRWLDARGVTFVTGPNPATDLTDDQILQQCKMYIAALRTADEFGCAAIGIQYQLGLMDLVPSSDLAEGLLNNVERPPVRHATSGAVLYEGRALPHFNEVDECAGLDALVTNRVWTALDLAPETTLHDLRWGEHYRGPDGRGDELDDFVWVFMISGAVPPAHNDGGYRGTTSLRQPPMYFHLGGGTLTGVSKPGELVWSRVFVMDDALHVDIGRGRAVSLPPDETARRWQATTPQWPIMHAVTYGVSRDQMMARHKANHVQVAYAPSPAAANRALAAKVAMMQGLGLQVHVCGTENGLVG